MTDRLFSLLVALVFAGGGLGPGPSFAETPASRPGAGDRIRYYRVLAPGGAYEVAQGSDLHYGRLGSHEGLWIACDRNGDQSAGRVYLIRSDKLTQAVPGGAIVADECFTPVLPNGDWSAFVKAHSTIDPAVMNDLRERIQTRLDDGGGPFLDLEAVTVAPGLSSPNEMHLYVVSEEPYSAILELALEGQGADARGRLVSVHLYPEDPKERGSACNDGLEGLAYAGRPGEFYWAEEGTRPDGGFLGPRLFFLDPRVGRGRLTDGKLEIERKVSDALTAAVRKLRQGTSQTLNALTVTPGGHLLAVDRNGGWILELDPVKGTARRYINLYDIDGVNLRKLLADFPGPRQMPYISIEGIIADPDGNLWLVDDPALPEAFHESCLVELVGMSPDRARPAGSVHSRPGGD